MPQNQFVPVATAAGANTLAPSAYASLGVLAQGFQSGVLPSIQFNTVLRQLSTVVSALGQFTADNQPLDVLDDGVVANFENKFTAALKGALAASSVHYGIASGTNDALVVTATPPLMPTITSTYQPGSFLLFKTTSGAANTTTAPTLNGNSIGNIAITRRSGAALAAGDLQANSWYGTFFDGTGCYLIALTNSDITAAITAALAPIQTELQDAVAGVGLTPNTDPTQLLQAIATGGIFIGTFGGSGNALTATIPGGITIPQPKAGMRVTGFITSTNSTTTPSLAVSGFTTGSSATTIKKRDGSAVAGGDISPALATFRFDGTYWRFDSFALSDLQTSSSTINTINTTINALLTGGIRTFTGNGTFTVPSGVTKIRVQAWGAGGGGGGASNGGSSGGGGGGEYRAGFFAVTDGQSIPITIGSAGSAGAASPGVGGNGGTTSVGTLISAGGGVGGPLSTSAGGGYAANGGAGGSGGSGGFGISGSPGSPGQYQSVGAGGGCAMTPNSPLNLNVGPGANNGASGVAGVFPGGGGSGASANSGYAFAGAAGAGGFVIIEY